MILDPQGVTSSGPWPVASCQCRTAGHFPGLPTVDGHWAVHRVLIQRFAVDLPSSGVYARSRHKHERQSWFCRPYGTPFLSPALTRRAKLCRPTIWDYSFAAQAVCDYHLPARVPPLRARSSLSVLSRTEVRSRVNEKQPSDAGLKAKLYHSSLDAGLKAGSSTL